MITVELYDEDNGHLDMDGGVAYRRVRWEGSERVIGGEESGPVDSLDDLADALVGAELSDRSEYPLDDLPTFGGVEPEDTRDVYSWDPWRLLVDDGQGGFYIQRRGMES